ncbi:MAG TPA: T9SS type A sorting domain-containing protein [Candidatus Eisenbacteria bacterium]|nr:T9SS type A sorting domain-containing protein [Candidatus Eisenbacteria bacterium]
MSIASMRIRRLAGVAAAIACIAIASDLFAQDVVVISPRPIDRKFPTGFCPIEVVFPFVAPGPSATLRFAANVSAAGGPTGQGIDNICVVSQSAYDANHGTCPACPTYNPAPPVTGLLFNRLGVLPFKELFDDDPAARGWDMSEGAWWDQSASAPNNPESGSSNVPPLGFLRLGGAYGDCPRDTARTGVVVSGLVTGQSYVLTGWWHAGVTMTLGQTTLVVSADTGPLHRNGTPSLWSGDATIPLQVAPTAMVNSQPALTRSGDAFYVVWSDNRNGALNHDIYGQRLDLLGRSYWGSSGLPVAAGALNETSPVIASDGLGGAIVVWGPSTNADLYAQRVNASGARMWGSSGVVVCNASGTQWRPVIVPDGTGGAYVIWEDQRNGGSIVADIYAQRFDAAGNPMWTGNGIPVASVTGNQTSPFATSDGAGGAVVVWPDARSSSTNRSDVYAQRLLSSGPAWTTNGILVCTSTFGDQRAPKAIADGAGGVVVVWEDGRANGGNGAGADELYLQRLNASGALQWPGGGVLACTAANDRFSAEIVSDGAAGAVLAWDDRRNLPQEDVYAQRVSSGGSLMWGPSGIQVVDAPNHQYSPRLTTDNQGGFLVAWSDLRYDTGNGTNSFFAQRLDLNGSLFWTSEGKPLLPYGTLPYFVMASDGGTGIVAAWFANPGLRMQRLDRFGDPGAREAAIRTIEDVPGDGGGQVRVRWDHSDLDLASSPGVTEYRIWKWLPPAAPAIVGTVPATAACSYTFVTSTPGDSVVGQPTPRVWVKVEARHSGSGYSWLSPPDSGFSIDNGVVSVGETEVPGAMSLRPVAPNPARDRAVVEFALPTSGPIDLAVFDLAGRRIASLRAGPAEAGVHQAVWDLKDELGNSTPSAIYFVRLQAGREERRRILVKLD